jgi:hypothetical protein
MIKRTDGSLSGGRRQGAAWRANNQLNFGWFGVLAISALVGLLMSAIWNIIAKGAVLPSQFAAGMMFCSVFFFPESNLSIGVGNLIIMVVMLSAISWALWALSTRQLIRASSHRARR